MANLSATTPTEGLDLSEHPPIYLSATHFATNELHDFEDDLAQAKAILTYDIAEARIVISKSTKKTRIRFDLRAKGLWTQDVTSDSRIQEVGSSSTTPQNSRQDRKRKRNSSLAGKSSADAVVIDDSSTESEHEIISRNQVEPGMKDASSCRGLHVHDPSNEKTGYTEPMVTVVSPAWFLDSRKSGQAEPLEPYTNFKGIRIEREVTPSNSPKPESISGATSSNTTASPLMATKVPHARSEILERAREDKPVSSKRWDRFGRRKFGLNTPSANPASWEAGHGAPAPHAHLLHATTTEHDDGYSSDLPEMPDWVKQGAKYACQRATLANSANDGFIALLKKIKLARLLTNDEIGVRAYSTSIASLAAYSHKISNPREIMALPGCDAKIANLFVEWSNTGQIKAVEDLETDEDLKVLRMFYDIWGVGATTAREFYYDKGWRDLDDIVEFGWSTLSRVQQIGVKFYEEFQDLIPRAEVARIGEIIHQHAVRVRDEDIQTMIVGGYRRGKEASGDVDIIVSHPEEGQTLNIVNDIVSSLEDEKWITHTLLLSLHNSHRGQATLPFRVGGGGHGFDTLDKALVVWQDPSWANKERDLAENPDAKNPNIHRRVDIIISPWRTVGCAIVGWSGGTTFQRDLRRYAKNARSWKFDSSGVRDRRNGEVVDMEGYYHWKGREGEEARAKSMLEAERRVFESMGLVYRRPEERCTH